MHRIPDFIKIDDTSEVAIYNNTGIDKFINLEYLEAIKEFNKALKLEPENPIVLINRALAWIQWGLSDIIIANKRINRGLREIAENPQGGVNVAEEFVQFVHKTLQFTLNLG